MDENSVYIENCLLKSEVAFWKATAEHLYSEVEQSEADADYWNGVACALVRAGFNPPL